MYALHCIVLRIVGTKLYVCLVVSRCLTTYRSDAVEVDLLSALDRELVFIYARYATMAAAAAVTVEVVVIVVVVVVVVVVVAVIVVEVVNVRVRVTITVAVVVVVVDVVVITDLGYVRWEL